MLKNKIKAWAILLLVLFCGLVLKKSSPVYAAIAETPEHVTLENIFNVPTISGQTNSASYTQDGVVTVTPLKGSTVGAVWSTEENKLDFNKDFYLSAYLNFGDRAYNSGDGMVFVIQATDNRYTTPTWFTYTGSAMGALGKQSISNTNVSYDTLGIRSSVAIEFDLFGNVEGGGYGYFDLPNITDPKKQHIAYVWPGSQIGYKDTAEGVLFPTYKRSVVHNALNTDFDRAVGATPAFLANGQWIKLEVKWSVASKELQYRVNVGNTDWVTIDSVNLQNIVLNQAVNPGQTAYWGFTGATGSLYMANQQVVFESVPGLVEADTNITSYRGETEITNNDFVYPGEVLTIAPKANYTSGKQSWKDVVTTVQLPTGVSYVEDSAYWLDENGEMQTLDGVVYNATTNTVTFPKTTLSSSVNVYAPRFKVQVSDTATDTLTYTATFKGSNYLDKTDDYQQKVAVVSEGEISLNQTEGIHLFDNDAVGLQFDGSWQDIAAPNQTQIYYETYLDNVLVKKNSLTGSSLSGAWSQGITDHSLTYGEHAFKVQLRNGMGELLDEKAITFLYQSLPEIELADFSESTFPLGASFDVSYKWQDLDSETGSIYYQMNDSKAILIAENVENPILGATNEGSLTIDTNSGSLGENTVCVFVMDSEGNKSKVATAKITLTGTLRYQSAPSDYGTGQTISLSESGVEIPLAGTPVTVEDSRGLATTWQVMLRLGGNLSDGKHELLNVLYVEDPVTKEQQLVTAENKILKETSSKTGETIPIAGDDSHSGFYLKIPQSAYVGNYQTTLEWTLQDAV